MKFSEILNSLENGKCITRYSWDNKSIFIYKQIPSIIFGNKIDFLQSMPKSAKDLICKGNNVDKSVKFVNQLCIVKNDTITTWLPNVEELFANDWYVLEATD